MKNQQRRKPRQMKKFRFQLMHQWLVRQFEPTRVADVGGGKGLLTYLLCQSGWEAEVIDPFWQALPTKYRSFEGKRVKIAPDENVSRRTTNFSPEITKEFGLIVGLHAHGCNMQIIKACAEQRCDFALLPCCVIGEPIIKQEGIRWTDSLVEYAQSLGLPVKEVQLNFRGRNRLIYTDRYLRKLRVQLPLDGVLREEMLTHGKLEHKAN